MGMTGKILLVDDDEGLLRLLKMRLCSEGFVVEACQDGIQCLQKLDVFEPDLLISDLRMDKMDGMTLFEEVSARKPLLPVIIITAHGTIPEAVEATQKGVFSFITKPIEKDQLLQVIQKALLQSGKSADQKASTWCQDIIAQSPVMQDVLKRARLAAHSESNVLIEGEQGTGKELLARSIHNASRRSQGPFVKASCLNLSDTNIETELLSPRVDGRGLSGASKKGGLFASAKGGTLFLDDLDALSLEAQVKLSSILGDGLSHSRVKNLSSEVRIISASHTSLKAGVAAQIFREDLFYNLSVINLRLPKLDDRREDISLLARSFLKKIATRQKPRVKSFSPKGLELICNAQWPGNVRQLYNTVERLVVLSATSVISECSVKATLEPQREQLQSLATAKSEFERQYLIQVLKQAKGNVSQAARAAQRNRTDFYKLMARHDLQPGQFKVR